MPAIFWVSFASSVSVLTPLNFWNPCRESWRETANLRQLFMMEVIVLKITSNKTIPLYPPPPPVPSGGGSC